MFQIETQKLISQASQHEKSIGNQSYKAVKCIGHSTKGTGFLTGL